MLILFKINQHFKLLEFRTIEFVVCMKDISRWKRQLDEKSREANMPLLLAVYLLFIYFFRKTVYVVSQLDNIYND